MDDAVAHILRAGTAAPACEDVARWWPAHLLGAARWRNTLDRAIAGGFEGDRVGWAFAAGYQAALHALFPDIPGDRICALCVTEAEGNAPRAIKTSLRASGSGWRLEGAKRWTTLGPSGALFLGTHFPTRPAGRVVPDGAVWRFVPE